MNLEEMETALKRYGFDNNDPLAVWINAAMHDLENESDWPWLEVKPITFEAVKGVSVLPTPLFNKVISIKDTDNKHKLIYYDQRKFVRDIEDPSEIGLAEIYTITSLEEVKIWRVLEVTTHFLMNYQAPVADLKEPTDKPKTAAVEWPLSTHYPIVQRAASIALQAENEEERAKVAETEFEKSLMRLRMKYGERELDEPTTVEDVQGYATTTPDRWTY